MNAALDALGAVLERRGWVRRGGGDYHIPGYRHVCWTHRLLPLRLWSTADRSGVREHVIGCARPGGARAGWAWRAELPGVPDAVALLVLDQAVAAQAAERGPEPGAVFTHLVDVGWEMVCGPDPEEPSYGAVSPLGASVVMLPDSPVDPGMWVVSVPAALIGAEHGAQLTASAGTPPGVVLAMAGV